MEAIPLAQRVLTSQERTLGPDHPNLATALNNLAALYIAQGNYADAEQLLKRSLAIQEKALGPDHPNVAQTLNFLAELYRTQGRYADAEPLYKRALASWEKALGPDDPNVAAVLNNLALLAQSKGQYADAEPLFKRSLTIYEKSFGSNHPTVARPLNNLATLYYYQGRYVDAEGLFKRVLTIQEKALGSDHPDFAQSLNNLAFLQASQGRYHDAEPLFRRALAIREKTFGPDHPSVAQSVGNVAGVLYDQGHYGDAEPLFKRALAIYEKAFGSDNSDVAQALNNLAALYNTQGRLGDAEPLHKRALAIREKVLGLSHPDVAKSLSNLALIYSSQSRYEEAEPLFKRSLLILEANFGANHPDVAQALNNLAGAYYEQGRIGDAEPLHKRALEIREKVLGPDHPALAETLDNLAGLYHASRRYADAEPLYERALAIREKARGPDHPDVATSLNNLAALYADQHRYDDAEPLFKRSLAIREKALGPNHPDVAGSLNNLAVIYEAEGRYGDALIVVKRTIGQDSAQKSTALNVLYVAESQSLLHPVEALELSYLVQQRSLKSSATGKAISMLAARFAAGSGELAQLVRKDQDLTAESDRLDKDIIAAVSKPPTERNAAAEERIRKRIDEIRLERAQLQEAFNQRFPDYVELSKPQPLSLRETQLLLDDDEALVAFDLDKTSYVWVITRNRAEWKALSVGAEDVSKAVAKLRVGLDPESPKPFDRNVAYQLYRQVLGPIEQIISGKPRLLFVLSGALTSLPPQVLITSDPENRNLASIDWLVRKYAITVLPSVASLKFLRGGKSVVAAAKPMIGFGDPIFDRSAQTGTGQKAVTLNRSLTAFYRGIIADTKSLAQALPPLPETADELRAVAKELGASSEDIHLGDEASVPNVKKWPLNIYHVVYFATHALVAGEVEKFAKVKAEPALVLSIPDRASEDDDGLLRASDVAMLKLNADFVVLSACNTAAGDKPRAEALSGLARAFFYAGARSLIVSNWEVDSESTVALMTGFFDALNANPHLSHSEALRLSMLIMIDHPLQSEWSQPKYWAPFIVVGEPRKN